MFFSEVRVVRVNQHRNDVQVEYRAGGVTYTTDLSVKEAKATAVKLAEAVKRAEHHDDTETPL